MNGEKIDHWVTCLGCNSIWQTINKLPSPLAALIQCPLCDGSKNANDEKEENAGKPQQPQQPKKRQVYTPEMIEMLVSKEYKSSELARMWNKPTSSISNARFMYRRKKPKQVKYWKVQKNATRPDIQ